MDIEVFMYAVMTSLYKMNAPIVFKGALVLKAIQMKYGNPSGLERETHDIDGDWVGQKPSMEYLRTLLQDAVVLAGYNYVRVNIKREYSDNRSAEFVFVDTRNNDVSVSMDLSIRYNNMYEQFSFASGISFYGQSIIKF